VLRSNATTPAHYAALIVAQLAIGSAAILARYGLGGGLSAVALSAWRMSLAALLLVVALHISRRAPASVKPLPLSTRSRLVVAGAFLGLHFVLWFASLERISVARSTLLVTSGPVWTGLGGWIFLRQRLGSRFWTGLFVASIGAFLVTEMGGKAGPGALSGDLLAVGGAIAVAAYLLLVQDLQTALGTGRTVAWTFASAAIALWPFVFVTDHATSTFFPANSMAWSSVVGMALVPQLVGHTLLNWSLKRFAAGVVAAATLLEPVFAAALAWLLFGELITWVQAAGAAILLAGVGLAIGKGANH
jgi:drug/metabolite transporter (DMT)-like permease